VSILPLSDIYEKNGLLRPGRTRDGLDVIIRIIVIGNESHDHLKILRTIATGENNLFSQFEDSKSEGTCAYGYWAKGSVGDIIEVPM
jgi:hypothetical protein